MNFFEIMINLCIGIIGGVFSSIIVSRIFLIQSLHSEQLVRVQEHFEYTYKLSGTLMFYLYVFSKEDAPKNADTICMLNNSLLEDIYDTANKECEKFHYMIFDDLEPDLHKIAVDLNDLMVRLNMLTDINCDIISSVNNDIYDLQKRFNIYKKSSNKYFKKRIINDKILRFLLRISIAILIITIISCFFK